MLKKRFENQDVLLCAAVSCPHRSLSPHSRQVSDKTSWLSGETVTYECERGFTLLGNLTSTCQADGSWSAAIPSCIGKIHINYYVDFCLTVTT